MGKKCRLQCITCSIGETLRYRPSSATTKTLLRFAIGISVRLELEALASEEGLELLVVGDDAIVDNGEFPVGIGSIRCNPGVSLIDRGCVRQAYWWYSWLQVN